MRVPLLRPGPRTGLALVIVLGVFVSVLHPAGGAHAATGGTVVGGILEGDTTWTAEGSPYLVSGGVQVPVGSSLTIGPGVTVVPDSQSALGFLVGGHLEIAGTADAPVIIDGLEVSSATGTFNAVSDHENAGTVSIAHARLQNLARVFQGAFAAVSLTDSVVYNVTLESMIVRQQSATIERNIFFNASGFYLAGQGLPVIIRHNRFQKQFGVGRPQLYVASSFGGAELTITENSFEPGSLAVYVSDYAPSPVDARNNYWGTTDTATIQAMIWDARDTIRIPYEVSYEPFLTKESALTPPALTLPGAPEHFTAEAGNQKVELSWQQPAETGGLPVTGYTVRSGGSRFSLPASADEFVIGELANNRRVSVSIEAKNPLGSGVPVSKTVLPRMADRDFNGDGTSDKAVFRPSNGTWYGAASGPVHWGKAGDVPVPADYNGDGATDLAVFRPSNGYWYIRGGQTTQYGKQGDLPVPADYTGDGRADLALFRPSTGTWHIRNGAKATYGRSGDRPVPADYNGDGMSDLAVFRPSTGFWYIKGAADLRWGTSSDLPVAADYTGDGKAEPAVFRPSTGGWHVKGLPVVICGKSGDQLIAANYDGDGTTDPAVFRPSTGYWYIEGQPGVPGGKQGDIAV